MSVVRLAQALHSEQFGGKAASLGRSLRAGLPVPPGYGVSVDALEAIARGSQVEIAILSNVVEELGVPLAARSSAVGEDAEESSFAGQHLTHLNVTSVETLVSALSDVYRSAHTDAALGYRKRHGILGEPRIGAVIQQLIDPVCAGVLFTRHPVTHAHEHVIEATWGLGEAVVAGLVTPDHYRLDRDGKLVETRLGDKDIAVRRSPEGGTREEPVDPALVDAACLDATWLERLHELAMRCEACFGADLDLEWAITRTELYLLQARPITTHGS